MKTRKVPIQQRGQAGRPDPARISVILACLLIGFAILGVYSRTFDYGFVSYDDDTYVSANPMVTEGFSVPRLAWAFTSRYASNWHPLTWISYMVDSQLFGLNPGEMHAVNVFLHLGSSILLFLLLHRATHRVWPSALVAGIFALHPLHVESVAWIAERKDVLSAFFQILTLWLYVRYTEQPKPGRYAGIVLAFGLSLLAKPMAVTLPFVLILLDIWPLRRFEWKRCLEKIPLLAMSAAASIVTFIAQRSTGAVIALNRLPFSYRLENAVDAYVRYIEKALWPVNLAVLYPLRRASTLNVSVAVVLLIAITILALLTFRRRPYVLVGWLWYLGMLVPVLGLVQVGFQSIADRYTYMPLIGLSIALIWAVCDAIENSALPKPVAASVAGLILFTLAIGAYRQTQYWASSIALYRHTLAVTTGNYIIHNNLGVALQVSGRRDEAIAQFRLAVAAAPEYTEALNNLGLLLAYQGNNAEAIVLHRRAIKIAPGYIDPHINLGHELLETGQLDDAYTELTEALRIRPDAARSHADLGALLAFRGNLEEARRHLEESLSLTPNNVDAENNLCYVLRSLGHLEQAIDQCQAALKIKPDMLDAQLNLAAALAAAGKTDAAAAIYSRVLAANPNHAGARAALDALWKAQRR